eukprot:TCALIF_06722-PB protein Name:"Similar to Nphs1 Nephrin (Rattus norvegicus)" AED:0.15 eAED:0.15 QI:0/0.73/0.56/0.93/0.46/0.5/16/48/873
MVPEIQEVLAVEGHSTQLPCDISPPNPLEQVYLVLWYRQDEGEPIYSYDARSGGGEIGRRWSDDHGGFGPRAYFQVQTLPAVLNIKDILQHEAGIYRCRVDFKTAPTRNSLINVTVVVPPGTPTIFDESGQEARTVVGPYLEGDSIILQCIASGGDPVPQVTWWRDSHLLDSSYETTFSQTVQNTLTIDKVSRKDLGAILTCQASNNNISIPVSTRVTVDLKFRPSRVRILTKKEPLSAGKYYRLECESGGARPAAIVTWWKNNKFMGKAPSKIVDNGNLTISTLEFKPKPSDHGKSITCRAENLEISNSALEEHWKLVIYHAPIVSLTFGANLNPSNIAEGNDVYFECTISANPDVYKVIWLHNDVMVNHEQTKGVIISGSSLVLQGVHRRQSGWYACVASNLEGDTQSNSIELKIMYKPICGNFKRVIQGVSRDRVSKIACPVEAHPKASRFTWSFNNSLESHNINASQYESNSTHSILSYEPKDDDDFGLIFCSASNAFGLMEEPCVFKIIPAGPPDPPSNCSVVNQTTDSLEVECLPGFDGGLEQTFQLEVTDLQTDLVLANDSGQVPEFVVTELVCRASSLRDPMQLNLLIQFKVSGLNSGRGLKITIFAVNSDGRSQPFVLEGFTLKVAELQLESPVPLEFTPVLGILIGVVLTLLLVALVIILVLRIKYRNHKPPQNMQNLGSRRQAKERPFKPDHNIKSAIPTQQDAEEYFCIQQPHPDDDNDQSQTYLLKESTLSHRQCPRSTEINGSHMSLVGSPRNNNPSPYFAEHTPSNNLQLPPKPYPSLNSRGTSHLQGGVGISSGYDPHALYSKVEPRSKRTVSNKRDPASNKACNLIVNPVQPEDGESDSKAWMPLLINSRQQESTL